MKLSRKFDYALIAVAIASIGLLFAGILSRDIAKTYAESDDASYVESESHFVTIFDQGKKLTIKTNATTVGDALSRAKVVLSEADIVEPGLTEAINADNFFINIYRARPVVIEDGAIEKYFMTASFDAKVIAKAAGLTVYDGDTIEMLPNQKFLETGVANIYKITRNGGRTVTVEEEVPFDEEKIKDYNMAPGVSEVKQLGEVGRKEMVYEVYYVDGKEVSRELIAENVVKEPVARVTAVAASLIEQKPLTAAMGRNYYTVTMDGQVIERQETYYDLPMSLVMTYRIGTGCGDGTYTVREDGVKVDKDGYVLVAANLERYPLCSEVETSLGPGKVYDTGTFAASNPEQFDIATDWTNRDGR